MLFRLLYFLIKQLFTIFQQLHQLFIFIFQLFYFLNVPSFLVQMFVDNLLLFKKFWMNHVHIIWICVSTHKQIVHACIGASCVGSTGSSSPILWDVYLICSILIFLCRSCAVAASVRCHACPVGADLLCAVVVVPNILRVVQIRVVWITRLLSFSWIWTLSHQPTTDSEHGTAWWISNASRYYVLVWWNCHRWVSRLSDVVLAAWWCCSVGTWTMVMALSRCLLAKKARWLLSSSSCMTWWCDPTTWSLASRSHRWDWTALLSTIFHML